MAAFLPYLIDIEKSDYDNYGNIRWVCVLCY
jgi:hypothetical protein